MVNDVVVFLEGNVPYFKEDVEINLLLKVAICYVVVQDSVNFNDGLVVKKVMNQGIIKIIIRGKVIVTSNCNNKKDLVLQVYFLVLGYRVVH